MAEKEKTQKVGFFKGVKGEFPRISWLDKATIAKRTAAVAIISLVVGVLISLLDTVIQWGLKFIM